MVTLPTIAQDELPVAYNERPTADDSIPEYLSAEEAAAVIDHAKLPEHRLIMLTMWRAGVRVSEALNLVVADLRLDERDALGRLRPKLLVRAGKRSKDRLVPIHRQLREAFRLVLTKKSRGRIWTVRRVTVYRWVEYAAMQAADAGLLPRDRACRVSPHTFRHSAAHHWIGSGVDIEKVRLWLGHTDIRVTQKYMRTSPDAPGDMENVP